MTPEHVAFIYFDLDDTLLDHRSAERRGLSDVCTEYASLFDGIPIEQVHETYHAHSVPLWREYASGALSKQDLMRLRFERTLESLHLESRRAGELNDYYLQRYARHWTLPQEARTAFQALSDQYPTGILTNGFAEVQHAKFEAFPELRERTAVLVISEEVGYMKPRPEIFEHAAEQARTAPEAILYVGDSYHSDVQGARGAGWQVAWYSEEKGADTDVFRFERWDALTNSLLR